MANLKGLIDSVSPEIIVTCRGEGNTSIHYKGIKKISYMELAGYDIEILKKEINTEIESKSGNVYFTWQGKNGRKEVLLVGKKKDKKQKEQTPRKPLGILERIYQKIKLNQ